MRTQYPRKLPVARHAPSRRKLMAVLVAACYSSAQAGMVAPSVVAGQASFSQQGKSYTITSTPNTIINWQGFSLATDEIARFVQQSADSRVLNRITGQDPSVILGAIQSNGKVFLINPNGVLFGASAQVDVNGLVASSLAISNSDFLAGRNNFSGASAAASVSNAGQIRTPAGGQVFLIAPSVENRGIISAPNGEVVLAAGHSVQLFEASDPNVQVVVSAAADQALNLGQIVAQGGRIGVYGALVNQRGRISADSAVRGAHGKIVLKSSGTTLLEQDSQTTALGSNLNVGGDIVVLGPQVGLSGNAVVDASGAAGGGSVLLGGDYQGSNPAIVHARQTYVGKDSVMRADALDTGDGGKVIVWADQRTRVYGSLSARGGAHGGNGGLVETSGQVLDMQGRVDTLAPQGRTGTLLLDPGNIYIAQDQATATAQGMTGVTSTGSTGAGLFADTSNSADSLLLTSQLLTALSTNDVIVSTSNSNAAGTGKISVLSDLVWTTNRNLTLTAAGDVRLNAAIHADNATLNLNAGGAITQTTSPVSALQVANLNALSAGSISLLNDYNRISGLTTLQATGGAAAITAKSLRLGSSQTHGNLTASVTEGALSVASNAVISSGGALSLSAQNGDGDIVVNSGAQLSATQALTLTVPDNGERRITLAGQLSSSDQIALHAGKMTLAAATLTAPAVSLSTTNSITLGADDNVANTLVLSSADLASAHASTLTVSSQRSNSPGSIVVSGALTLPASQTLELNATGAIGLQAALSAGGLTLNAGSDSAITASAAVSVGGVFELLSGRWEQKGALPAFSATDFRLTGGSFLRASGADGTGASATPYVLADIYGLQGINTLDLSNWYSLSGDIAAGVTSTWNGGAGFQPLGGFQLPYTGTFNGNGHVISGLEINRPTQNYVGLFATLGGGTVTNLTLSGGSVVGRNYVGAVAGSTEGASSVLNQLSSSTSVSGIYNVGGLVGEHQGQLSHSAASAAVTGNAGGDASNIGGLVGRNVGSIELSHASGAVAGNGYGYAGGLVGSNTNEGLSAIGTISTSYASGNVSSAGEIVGGLVGDNRGGNISKSYASGNVSGERNVGGLVGRSGLLDGYGGAIANAYATGNVTGSQNNYALVHANLGGLLGEYSSGSVDLVYSAGSVTAPGFSSVGGLVGADLAGNLTHAYYNSETAGLTAGSGSARTSAQMRQREYFSGFTFSGSPVWRIYENQTMPLLKDLLTPITVSVTGVNSISRPYDGTSSVLSGASAGTLPAGIAGTLSWVGDARNAGTYNIGGLYSGTYDISYANNNPQLTITPRVVTATASALKTYDGSASVEQPSNYTLTLQNVLASDTNLSLSATVAFVDRYAGTGKTLIVSNPQLQGSDSVNYVLNGSVTGSGTISQRPLNLSDVVLQASRVYNGTDAISFTGGNSIVAGLNGDEVSLLTAGTATAHYNNKNVGNNKPVIFTLAGYVLTGAEAANYVVAPPAEAVASITPAPLSIAGVTAQDRVYNRVPDPGAGNAISYGTLATLNTAGATLSGVLGNDVVTVQSARGSFQDRMVGNHKPVIGRAATLGGADGGNYQVTSFPEGMSASITPAPLTVTLASRTYNNSATGSLVNATLGGLQHDGEANLDDVTLVTGSAVASYADKNVGVNKGVTFSNSLALSGSDAGNYTLNPTGVGTITARPTSTWVGTGGGLWSAASNWADSIAPDGANVLAAVLGSGKGTITYDAAAGSTTVNTINGGSGTNLTLTGGTLTLASGSSTLDGESLNLNGGNLVMNGNLGVNTLNLTSGVLSGTNSGAMLTANHVTHTGGSLNISGALAVEYGGNISLGTVRAQSGITLNTGEGGSITQTGGWTSDSLNAHSTTGITLTSNANHLAAFTAGSTTGNIELNNTADGGTLTLGALQTDGNILIDNYGGVVANGTILAQHSSVNRGRVSIAAHSPVTINGAVNGNELAFSASTAINLGSGAALNAVNQIQLTAGTDIVLGGSLAISSPTGSITATATNGAITVGSATSISSNGGSVTLAAPQGSVTTSNISYGSNTVPTVNSGSAAAAAAAAAAAQAAADAAAKAAADAAAKAAADAAAKAAADAAAKAAADAAAKAAADAAAKAAADEAAKAAADAAAKAAADAAAKAAADAAAKAAADAAAKAAADAAAQAAAKAAADAAAAKAAAEAAAEAAAKAAADAAAKIAADAAAGSGQPSEPLTQVINSTVKLQNITGAGPQQNSVAVLSLLSGGGNGAAAGQGNSAPVGGGAGSGGGGGSGGSSGSTGGASSGSSPPDDKAAGEKAGDKPAEQGKSSGKDMSKMYCN